MLMLARCPGDPNPVHGGPPIPAGQPSRNDAPFQSLSVGYYPPPPPGGTEPQFPNYSINNSLFRNGPNGMLLDVRDPTGIPKVHPFERHELLTKLFSNVTTRSNVFAVFLTVGFFEVINDQTRPVKLGAEIGKAEGKNVRHRMFAIVDRTNLMVQANLSTYAAGVRSGIPASTPNVLPFVVSGAAPPPPTTWIPLSKLEDTFTLSPPVPGLTWKWKITPGTILVVDRGTPNEEQLLVTELDTTGSLLPPPPPFPPRIKVQSLANPAVTFIKSHNAGAPFSIYFVPGNPGPQANFDLRTGTAVVPYYSVIQ
jgi:hypothetical protein